MFRPDIPLAIRILSLYHGWLPFLLLWMVRQLGYVGFILESGENVLLPARGADGGRQPPPAPLPGSPPFSQRFVRWDVVLRNPVPNVFDLSYGNRFLECHCHLQSPWLTSPATSRRTSVPAEPRRSTGRH